MLIRDVDIAHHPKVMFTGSTMLTDMFSVGKFPSLCGGTDLLFATCSISAQTDGPIGVFLRSSAYFETVLLTILQ